MNYAKLLVISVLITALLLAGCTEQITTTNDTTDITVESTGEIKEFDIVAKQFEFEPSPITVNLGDTVKLNLTSEDTTHGFNLTDFGVNATIEPGKTTTVEFVANKAGTFTFKCNVYCGSGHQQMAGTLIVN